MPQFSNNLLNIAYPWLSTSGIKIAVIIVAAFVVRKFAHVIIERFIRKIIIPSHFHSKEAETKREDTLINIISSTLGVIVLLIACMMVLQELGVAVAPLLAAAGIIGLAFGFGGQYLIRDIISGLFIIMENQYRIGDVVCFDSTCGVIESISLRMTSMRDMDGTVHYIPHGEIKKVANMTKEYSRVNLDIGIAYNSNLENVIEVVNDVGNEMANDPGWKESIVKAPKFLRIQDFADSSIVIKIFGETQPAKQWEVSGELRKRLKIAFDKEGIDIPFPQRVVHQAK